MEMFVSIPETKLKSLDLSSGPENGIKYEDKVYSVIREFVVSSWPTGAAIVEGN